MEWAEYGIGRKLNVWKLEWAENGMCRKMEFAEKLNLQKNGMCRKQNVQKIECD